MSITFRCEHCHKDVTAPDGVGGKRGKCPFCGQSTYIPEPVSEDELLDMTPIDEVSDHRQEEDIRSLREQELDLLSEQNENPSETPLEHREKIDSKDLHHFVVNYCFDMSNGDIERAATHAQKLRKFGPPGLQAVEDFLTGSVIEPALDMLPRDALEGFLKQLRKEIAQ